MTANAIEPQGTAEAALTKKTYEFLASGGDARSLNQADRNAYYNYRCQLAGLDPATVPFQWLNLSGKTVLYAVKGCTDMLAGKHKVALEILSQVTEGDDMRVVTVRARTPDGHQTDEVGTVDLGGLKGEKRANAMLRCVTKAKRRAILSLLGLGMLDETEVETIPGATTLEGTMVGRPTKAHAELAATAEALKPSFDAVEDALHKPLPEGEEQAPEEPTTGPKLATITPAQQKRLFAILRESGVPEAAFREHLAAEGLASTKDITKGRYDDFVDWIREAAAGPDEPAPSGATAATAGPRQDH